LKSKKIEVVATTDIPHNTKDINHITFENLPKTTSLPTVVVNGLELNKINDTVLLKSKKK